jgi:hypothetical protein
MGPILGVLAIVVLAAVVVFNVLAIRYYLSLYARATKRSFVDVMRNKALRRRYQLARYVQKGVDRVTDRVLFDVLVPLAGAEAVLVDAVALTPRALFAFTLQEGAVGAVGAKAKDAALEGAPGEVAVGAEGAAAGGSAVEATAGSLPVVRALVEYLNLEGEDVACVIPLVVLNEASWTPSAGNGESAARAVFARGLAGNMRLAQEGREERLDETRRKRLYHALKACANSTAAKTGDVIESSDAVAWVKDVLQRRRSESVGGDLIRQADQLLSQKEDFDALTWDRIMEISREMEGVRDSERRADLAAELRLIARTNIALNFRFGIPDQQLEGDAVPAAAPKAADSSGMAEPFDLSFLEEPKDEDEGEVSHV